MLQNVFEQLSEMSENSDIFLTKLDGGGTISFSLVSRGGWLSSLLLATTSDDYNG